MFPDISLHILDIVQNSIKAGADLIEINIAVDMAAKRLKVSVRDNGCGMTKEQLLECQNPFFTSRTTRKVGLGIPFLKHSAECTGGTFSITSEPGQGTCIMAEYHMDHIDCIPLGDVNATIYSLVIMNGNLNFIYEYRIDDRSFVLDTREIQSILGEVPMDNPEVAAFIREFLDENKKETDLGNSF